MEGLRLRFDAVARRKGPALRQAKKANHRAGAFSLEKKKELYFVLFITKVIRRGRVLPGGHSREKGSTSLLARISRKGSTGQSRDRAQAGKRNGGNNLLYSQRIREKKECLKFFT